MRIAPDVSHIASFDQEHGTHDEPATPDPVTGPGSGPPRRELVASEVLDNALDRH